MRFEPEAVRRVIRDHTSEAGVADLDRKLAAICRHVVRRRPPDDPGPEVVTPATVREVLGDGAADALPSAVRAAIARARQGDSDTDHGWVEWLRELPWTRRSGVPIDLARVRAALDAGHAGLDDAKACLLEHLAVRRRNPASPAVLCLAGPPSRVS